MRRLNIGEISDGNNKFTVFINKDGDLEYIEKGHKCSKGLINFNDPILEKAIREEIGKKNGVLREKDLERVETLDVSTYDIKDFTGLDKLKNLKVFKAWMVPSISKSLDLIKKLKNLEFIDIGSCNIPYFKPDTFEGLDNLKEIAIDGNMVFEIYGGLFESNTSLKWLHVNGTGIAKLDFLKGLDNLEGLYAEDNRINNLDGLRYTPNLKVLRLSNNNIRDIKNIACISTIEKLHIDNNKIKEIKALKNLKNLQSLRAQDNYITDIYPIKDLNKIEVLYLDDNKIQDISPLRYKANLVHLQITNNRLKTVEPLNKLANLRVLNIEGNKVMDYSHLRNIYGDLTNKDF